MLTIIILALVVRQNVGICADCMRILCATTAPGLHYSDRSQRHHYTNPVFPGIVPDRDGFGNWQKSARFFEKNKNEISGRIWDVGGYQNILQPNFEKKIFEISN